MSSDNANKDTKILTVTKFPHGQQDTPRAVRWRDWQRKLLFCFGSHFPMLARQTADPLDPSLPWWGLTWLYDFDSMSAQDEQKVFSEFLKAQYSLLHILTENFYTQEKQLINNHEPIALAKKMKDLYSREWDKTLLKHFPDKDGWTPTEWMSAYIPFGYMCLKALADKYDETGVSDAIAKYDEWEKSKKFNSKDINAWASNVEASFAAWFNVAGENPSYMAAVEIVRGILSSDNEDWRQWAFAFSTSQGEKPYTVPELLEKILTQHKLHLAGNGKTKATAFLDGHHLHKPPKFKHPRTNKNNKQGKPKKKCKTEGCSNHVSHHFHKWCDDCYDKHKKKSTTDDSDITLNEVPLAVRKENHTRKLAALKKKMAQINSATTKKKRESALHEANALLADVSTGLAKKGKKCVNIEEEEVGMAEACALQNLKPSTELKVTSKRKSLHARIAKQGKFAHTSGKLANKKQLPKANKQAAEQDPLLGLTVQRFAGCAMPSNYSK